MKTILITKNKLVPDVPLVLIVLIDDEDYENIVSHSWFVYPSRRNFYAARQIKLNGKKVKVQMHREILGLTFGDGKIVDHINRNGLDNRKSNLRIASHSLNRYNSSMRIDNVSGYRGVFWHKKSKRWRATICIEYNQIYLGQYIDKTAAAEAYDQAAIKFYGDKAVLNFPERLNEYLLLDGKIIRQKRIIQINNTSGYRGVSWYNKIKRWVARIKISGKFMSLGCYKTAEQAAIAFDLAEIKYRGVAANLNFKKVDII